MEDAIQIANSCSACDRDNQPPLLAVWGENDPSFIPAGANAFKRDVPGAEIQFVPSGHFALESHHTEIARLMKEFLDSNMIFVAQKGYEKEK